MSLKSLQFVMHEESLEQVKRILIWKKLSKFLDKDTSSMRRRLLTQSKVHRPTPDKVFREVKEGRSFVLIPASDAIGIVLRNNLTEEPTLDELEKLLKNTL